MRFSKYKFTNTYVQQGLIKLPDFLPARELSGWGWSGWRAGVGGDCRRRRGREARCRYRSRSGCGRADFRAKTKRLKKCHSISKSYTLNIKLGSKRIHFSVKNKKETLSKLVYTVLYFPSRDWQVFLKLRSYKKNELK